MSFLGVSVVGCWFGIFILGKDRVLEFNLLGFEITGSFVVSGVIIVFCSDNSSGILVF